MFYSEKILEGVEIEQTHERLAKATLITLLYTQNIRNRRLGLVSA